MRPVSSTDHPFVSSCSPRPVARTQLLSTRGGKHRHRGTSTLPCTLLLKRTSATVPIAVGRVSRPTPALIPSSGFIPGLAALQEKAAGMCLAGRQTRRSGRPRSKKQNRRDLNRGWTQMGKGSPLSALIRVNLRFMHGAISGKEMPKSGVYACNRTGILDWLCPRCHQPGH